MKALKIFGIGLIMVVFLVMIFTSFANYWMVILSEDVYYVSYPTYDAAVDAYAVGDQGFMPAFLPHSANDIRYLSWFGELWLSFNFDVEEISKIRQYCGGPVHGEIELAPEPPELYFIDWPEEITGDAPVKAEDVSGYEFYRCEYGSRDDVIAVDTGKGKAYHYDWRKD